MKKAIAILLTALLMLTVFVSCEGDVEDLFGKTVSFNGNGSTSGQMAQMKVKKGEEVTLPANEFTRTDYVFAGWNTQADGSGTGYADKAKASFDDNTVLYAQWIEEVTITFNANDGSETPATKTQKVGKGVETALDANTFEKSGFYFAHWNTDPDDKSSEYADGATVTLESNLVLYAIWSSNPVITLSKGTGINEVTGSGSYAPGATVSIDATMSDGYKWSKWTQTTGGADVSTTKAYSFEMGTQNIAYTANAEPISYSVEFNKNSDDATGTMANQSFKYDTAQNLTANAYSWESHSFAGWNTSADGKGTSYADGASVSNLTTTDGATVTLYAKWVDGPKVITSTEDAITLTSGDWTITDTTVTVGGRITIDGTVNLLLPDGKTLNASKGITVSEGNTLVIDKYDSESTGTGILNATAETFEYGNNYAGIGGGNKDGYRTAGTITVKYGTVTATGGWGAAGIGGGRSGSGGTVTIKGGTVTARGGSNGAGIGGGYNGAGGTITISGGTVKATGGSDAAGIGGGYGNHEDHLVGAGGTISISGGNITATGGNGGAGIGGGLNGDGGTLSVSDGTVVANGVNNGAGIGGGAHADGGKVTIEGGTVSATGEVGGAGIGGGGNYNGAGGVGADVTIKGGVVTATGGVSAVGIGAGNGSSNHGALTIGDGVIMMVSTNNTYWSVYDGSTRKQYMKVPEPTVLTSSMTSWEGGKVYTLGDEDVTIDSRITVSGSVGLILPKDKTLTASSGITVTGTNSLTINGKGSLIAGGAGTTPSKAAGIGGGGENQAGGTITINSGTVTATGGAGGGGIGGGYKGAGGTVTITGGAVTANGGDRAAGIGGGYEGAGGTVTINGGAVSANGGDRAAGIGGGWCGTTGGTVTINGGTVDAIGGSNGAGIGGGYDGAGGTVTINGGTVTANGVSGGAGIGGGYYGKGGTVTISGGSVTANGGQDAHGIGRGYGGSIDGTLTIGENSTTPYTDGKLRIASGWVLYYGESSASTSIGEGIYDSWSDYAKKYMKVTQPST